MSDTIDDFQAIAEWIESFDSVREFEGDSSARDILSSVLEHARQAGVAVGGGVNTAYSNTISTDNQVALPDDGALAQRVIDYCRWNAIAMVMKAGKTKPELGGHIASYGSSAFLFEMGLNYFFRAATADFPGDLVYFQGHSSPGIYARAFLEGRITAEQLDNFRQEAFNDGLSSYPHPKLMPEFWQFPVVSMGLGPLLAIYQAQFLKYCMHRKIGHTADQRIWVFCGDGELGEPESLGALNIAARDGLDNLTFVISCNLQRLDGPVSGNSQIIQEYEGVFRGAGWNVIKVIWGSAWDQLFARDKKGLLLKRMGELIDGEQQSYVSKDGAFLRENFFGRSPELLELVKDMTDDDLNALNDGGHDWVKLYSAYHTAVNHTGQPTVILAKTIKGYGMGSETGGEGTNTTHSNKKMSIEARKVFRDRFNLPLTDEQVENLDYLSLPVNGEEERYLHAQRKKLGGYLPLRDSSCDTLPVPKLAAFQALLSGSNEREMSTTMAFVRALGILLKDKKIGSRVVPIVADEARTFGMEGLFRQVGIYAPFGQQYTPEDKKQLLYYREDQGGQLFQQGISEAGGMCCWTAAATSYVHSNEPMIPFFIYYSMFGFQRFGDLVWSAGDAQARGFIIGATAGRTSLAGEGLQHQDGHNLIMFSMVPSCVTYDPCFAYEMIVIMQHGLERMYAKKENVFYYITAMNENYKQPQMPDGVEQDIIKGMYAFSKSQLTDVPRVRLLGGGTILREVIRAAEILEKDYSVAADVWSVTSFNELRLDCESTARHNRLHPEAEAKHSHVMQCLPGADAPVIAASDYMKLYAEQVRQDIVAPYFVLGTDGFGRSDTRAALRSFFEVDTNMIVYTALKALVDQGDFALEDLMKAKQALQIDSNRPDPVSS
jgi:pyruvate dehydrogenase E1 component